MSNSKLEVNGESMQCLNSNWDAEQDPISNDTSFCTSTTASLGSTSNKSSSPLAISIEPVLKPLQQPVSINRPIFLAQNFYPSTGSLKSTNNDKFKWRKFVSLAKQSLSFRKSRPKTEESKKSTCSLVSLLFTLLPALKWLSTYSIRDYLLSDIITGATLVALHIPQGLAYGRLAGAEPINGLYVSLFPVIVYALFGGSRQVSIGTFAVISIACRDVVEQITNENSINGSQGNGTFLQPTETVTPIEILTSLCLLVGVIQFLLGLLRLGFLAILLSDPIISAFCVAAAVHVFTSQIFSLTGVDSTVQPNEPAIPFEIVRSWYRLLSNLMTVNLATMGISTLTVASLIVCKNYLEPYLMKRFSLKSIAIPIEIISIVALTVISLLVDLNGNYGVQLIPSIAAGFDGLPVVPRVDLWPRIFPSAALIAFICYAGTFSLQKMYAKKNGYQVYANQELMALGLATGVSAFFNCYPCSGSLGRSAVADKVGGKTQLGPLISSLLLFIFIQWLSQFLVTLPRCSLACIIFVALIATFKKATEVLHFWKVSKLDGTLWIATFISVLLLGVDRGLLAGLAIGLAMVLLRLAIPQMNLKYGVINSECYLSDAILSDHSNQKLSAPGMIIFEFHGPLLFINVERFKSRFADLVLKKIQSNQIHKSVGEPTIHTVIFDLSTISYLDGKAVECLLEMDQELAKVTSSTVRLSLANVSLPIWQTLHQCQFFDSFAAKRVFLTVQDAVIANNC